MDNERWEIGKKKLNNPNHEETRSKIINETEMKTSAKVGCNLSPSAKLNRMKQGDLTSPLNCKSHFACYQRCDVCLSAHPHLSTEVPEGPAYFSRT
jgi:hypothetical protein